MGEHPILYTKEGDKWEEPPHRIVSRYLDSGIPVLVALSTDPKSLGHVVVAVGSVADADKLGDLDQAHPTIADAVSHYLVNDDQGGAYRRLPLTAAIESPDGMNFNLNDHCLFVLIPLPDKVFMKAEVAETLARDKIEQLYNRRRQHVREALGKEAATWVPDPTFFAAKAKPAQLIARTYLTYGWKYKQRMLENDVGEQIKDELAQVQLPRYVWVTEFTLPAEMTSLDPCHPRVCAHVVTDATGSRYEESVVLTHMPGMLVVQAYDTENPRNGPDTILRAMNEDPRYMPKVRGWLDYRECAVPTADAGRPKKRRS